MIIPFLIPFTYNSKIENTEPDKEKILNSVIKSLLHIYLREETDFDKKLIADFARDNTTKEQYLSIANLCMEYVNLNWDIEKFRKKVTEEIINKIT